jgi:Tfp pilus assembly PilM family ATPase/Tfp pilus assembly protein PilN
MLKSLPLFNKERYTGLEIEGSFIKLAQAEDFRNSRKIVKLVVKKIPSQSEKDIVDTLRSILHEIGGSIGHLVISIPRHKVAVRFLSFPTVDEKEIEGMVKLQSVKELPYAKEEIVSDYLITGRNKDGYSKIALAIVHQDVLTEYLNILKKVNLEPERITFSTEAILSWYKAAFKYDKCKDCSVLINLDVQDTDIAILCNSSLGYTRGLNWGLNQLQQRVDLKHKLAAEVRRTIEGFIRQKNTKRIERIFLTPAAETIQGLKTFLAEEFKLPCQILPLLKSLTYQKEFSAMQNQFELSLHKILGIVLQTKGKKLNLLPLDLRQKQYLQLKKKKIVAAFLLLLGIMILGIVVFVKKTNDKYLNILYLDREIKRIAPKALQIEQMLKKIEMIKKQIRVKGSSIDILHRLPDLVPVDIALSSFNYDEESRIVTLQGISTDMPEIFEFISALKKPGFFQKVQLKYARESKKKAGIGTNFKIECRIKQE